MATTIKIVVAYDYASNPPVETEFTGETWEAAKLETLEDGTLRYRNSTTYFKAIPDEPRPAPTSKTAPVVTNTVQPVVPRKCCGRR